MPRLWMKRLTSIGAVPEGDNPPAEILLYKARKVAKGDRMDEVEVVADVTVEAGPDAPETAKAEPEPEPEAKAEGVEDDIAKRIETAEGEIRKARDERDAALQALADEVRKARWVDFAVKAEKLEALLGPAKEAAPTLEALEAKAPEAFADLEKRLTVALDRIQLTKELGTAGDDGADPISKRDAWARRYVLDHPEVSTQKANALFWKVNPDALEAQREEQ